MLVFFYASPTAAKHRRNGKYKRVMKRSRNMKARQQLLIYNQDQKKSTDILEEIDLQKQTGHILSSIQEKQNQITTNWYPRDSNRYRAQQQRRWANELKLTMLPKWRRIENRKQWKLLEQAFVKRHTELRDILQPNE